MENVKFDKDAFRSAPRAPGVYKFLDRKGEVIYVGKAKSLRNRIGSYFSNSNKANAKTRRLCEQIRFFEFIVAPSENDALMVEGQLIKDHQPRYNIMLKDGKSYVGVVVTDEPFARVFATRNHRPGMGSYFGPYASAKAVDDFLTVIKKLYKVRSCRLPLTPSNIEKKKFSLCLEYHIGNCLGPCTGLQSLESYQKDIERIKLILKGKVENIKSEFRREMKASADGLAFERAHEFKQKLVLLTQFQRSMLVSDPRITRTDVFTIVEKKGGYIINYMNIYRGMIRGSWNVEVANPLDKTPEHVLAYAVAHLRKRYGSESRKILTNVSITNPGVDAQVSVPKIGSKKKLVDLSVFNGTQYRFKNPSITRVSSPGGVETLRDDLGMEALPTHIECFDNSNIQGSSPVASMVCFRDARPSKKEYRKFHLRSVQGADDFESMYEVVLRAYSSRLKEGKPIPDLVVVDGGKGQLNAARRALVELGIDSKIYLVGISKKLEEIHRVGDPIPLHINKRSPSLRLLQRLRNEAHRFAVTFHRQTRSKQSLLSSLDQIEGIGVKSKKRLLDHFGKPENIRKATLEEFCKILPSVRARLVFAKFHSLPAEKEEGTPQEDSSPSVTGSRRKRSEHDIPP